MHLKRGRLEGRGGQGAILPGMAMSTISKLSRCPFSSGGYVMHSQPLTRGFASHSVPSSFNFVSFFSFFENLIFEVQKAFIVLFKNI